ncbi:MAG: phytanoyl-CoA dioxygenase family protein [Pseudomonadales bacterium]|nr:phytanoyl-CoA dioxygenase family protein [Pseudomonadales bacterium]
MQDEGGVEIVPGTHRRWDTQEELDVRLEENGRHHYDDLIGARQIPLNKGDALLFSANMIHRGLYGMDRFALDILVSDPDISLLEFADEANLPNEEMRQKMDNPTLFDNTILPRRKP